MIDSPSRGSIISWTRRSETFPERKRSNVQNTTPASSFRALTSSIELTVFEVRNWPMLYTKAKYVGRTQKKRTEELLERMNSDTRRNLTLLQQLSGGQQQRVAVARAIVNSPKLILADEPTGNLDSSNGDDVMKTLAQLNQEGTTIIMVTHSPYCAEFGNRIIRLLDGQVVTENLVQQYL
ncbi:MAG: ATP-binding cassette domain-containing protein [Saprospiraceae bacterium]